MSKMKKDIKSKNIIDYINENVKIMNCHDITGDFKYDGMLIYDCKIDTSFIKLAMVDKDENVNYMNLQDINVDNDEVNQVVSVILKKLENDISSRYSLDNLNIFFDTYTFFDYSDEIKFVMLFDFLNQSYSKIKPIKADIINRQLNGNSKFLN